MHLNLLMQDGKHSAIDALGNQFTWNNAITDEHTVFNSFLSTIVGCVYAMRQKTFQTILEKCNDWEQQNWKNLMLLLRAVIDANEFKKYNSDERNEFKTIAKSMASSTSSTCLAFRIIHTKLMHSHFGFRIYKGYVPSIC